MLAALQEVWGLSPCYLRTPQSPRVGHVSDPSSLHYSPLLSRHYFPSVCSLCSSCLLSPSNPSSSSHLSVCNVSYMCEPPVCWLYTREEERKGGEDGRGEREASLLSDTNARRKETSMGLLIKSASGWLAANTSTFLQVQPRLRCCRRGQSGWSYWSAPS